MATSTKMEAAPSITLFRGWREPGKHVWSPFVVKVEARLRFAGVKYKIDSGSPMHAPKGKIPYLEYRGELPADAVGGLYVREDETSEPVLSLSDSALIIKTLTQAGVLPDLNGNLSAKDKLTDMGLRTMLEDKLYFYHVCPFAIVISLYTDMLPRQRSDGLTTTTPCATTSYGAFRILYG